LLLFSSYNTHNLKSLPVTALQQGRVSTDKLVVDALLTLEQAKLLARVIERDPEFIIYSGNALNYRAIGVALREIGATSKALVFYNLAMTAIRKKQ